MVRQNRAGLIVSTARQMGFSIAASVAATMIVAALQNHQRGAELRPTPALTSGGKFAARLDGGDVSPVEKLDADVSGSQPLDQSLASMLSAIPPLGFPGIGEGSIEAGQSGRPATAQHAVVAVHLVARRHPGVGHAATPPRRSDFIAPPIALATADGERATAVEVAMTTLRASTSAAYHQAVGFVDAAWQQVVLPSF